MPAGFIDEPAIGRQILEANGRDDAQLAVQIMQTRAGPVAHDKMDAAIDEILPTPPGGGNPTRVDVMLKDAALIAVHLGVAAGGQACQPSADDDDLFFTHFSLPSVPGPRFYSSP